tara:strand:+ start:424 stop:2502 length:2079 start_codon:yes stop_codon:yes gene_type:complete
MAVDRNELILEFKFVADNARRNVKKTNSLLGRFRQSTSGIRREIGGLRNDLLLASFAFAGVTAAISKLVGVSARFEAVRTRLVGLTGSVENAEQAFDNFNRIASKTPFSLEDVVDAGAQLEAFGADSDALIGSITDLASFMGTTAVEAANAFGRAFAGGAGAADILRERGILNIIKTSQGLTDLSKTTLPEFRQALISAMQDPVVGIAGSADRLSETFQGLISNTGDSFTRLADSVGDILIPVFTPLIKRLKEGAESAEDFFRKSTETNLETTIRQLKEMGASIETIAKLQETQLLVQLIELEQKQRDLNLQGKDSADIYKEIAEENSRILDSQVQFSSKVNESALNEQKLLDINKSLKALGESLNQNAKNTLILSKDEVDLVTRRIEDLNIEKSFLESKNRVIESNFTFSQRELEASQIKLKTLSSEFSLLQNIEKIRDKLFGQAKVEAEIKPVLLSPGERPKIFDVMDEELGNLSEGFFEELSQEEQFFQDLMKDMNKLVVDDFQTEQEIFRERLELRKKDLARMEENKQKEIDAIRERAQVFKKFSDNIAFAVINGQNLGDAMVNSIKAIAAELIAQQAALSLLKLFGFPGATAAEAGFNLLGGFKKFFGFHQGGLIGGNANNVPIVAQSGEFVMQRSAVQSIGLDSLSMMNETGQASNVTVNIHGGVVQEDYVTNTLIPAINNAKAMS